MSWWREEPLTDFERELLDEVTKAHYSNTFRANQSAVAVQLAASGSGNYFQSIAMAILTLGGQHAAIHEAYDIVSSDNPALEARKRLVAGKRVAGWGNAFVKDQIDPAWDKVVLLLKKEPIWFNSIEAVQAVMDSYDKKLFPNPACFSATTAVVLKLPRHLCGWVGAMGRITAWSQLFHRAYKEPLS